MKRRISRAALAKAAQGPAVARLSRGSSIVWQRRTEALAAWVREGRRADLEGWRAALGPCVRLVLLGAVAYGIWAAVRAWPWLMWLITAAWARAAWKAGRDDADEELDDQADELSPQDRLAAARQAFVEYLVEAIGEGRGVHLSTLAEGMRASGHLPGWDVADVRAHCERLGIPWRRSVKVGRSVTYGVHRDDLPTPTPAEADDVAA